MKKFNNNSDKFSTEDLFTIELIPDEQEYKEQMIDAHLKWVCGNDPHSPLKNLGMVDCQSEIDYFMSRKQELEQEKEFYIHQIKSQFKQEEQEIQTAEPSEISTVGPDYVVQDKIQQYREQEIRKREISCDQQVQLIAERYSTLKQQCEERINQANANYQTYFRIWQKEHNTDTG
ncbi:hypothetical protein BLD44_020470 [Mastigocladus laminosus UU774]|nr:hypothetical protein BLD44_020470 [Mastigocladus laminosus UU774]